MEDATQGVGMGAATSCVSLVNYGFYVGFYARLNARLFACFFSIGISEDRFRIARDSSFS